ncbi:MAG: selenocysteine-specific translation elongation factor [Chloroflexota bacterium]|nr:selenocysteine-specific translation elongation factor [Chloroflexota bacterium]MDE3268392.1 selenocysteine-specific translation elongation factor [Chloroflexota bacterium]
MFVIGTAGHVDHGKSTLVKALTGIDPDRLREEKERGLTIELGFAWLTLPSGREVSIVDVPGHERFIRHMLAGVGGIDLALLVIAANESVMPQTREHLAILDLLRVERGLVVVAKRDLVDAEMVELVMAEVEDVLQDTTLEGAPMVAVSAVTGEGVPELLSTLDGMLDAAETRRDTGRPRLPIDRSFTMPGFGAVVTGTLIDGSLSVGMEVQLLPSGRVSRIRGLQSHQQKLETATPGRRLAVNLSGVSHDDIERGDVLTIPGWLRPTIAADVRLRLLDSAPRGLRHNRPVTFHTGSTESVARVRLLERDEAAPGEEVWAQVRLDNPLALVKGDYFVIRSSDATLGGGAVVEPHAKRHRRRHAPTLERLEVLERGSLEEVALQAIRSGEPCTLEALAGRANLSVKEAEGVVEQLAREGGVVTLPLGPVTQRSQLYTAAGWSTLAGRANGALGQYHREHPLRRGMQREELRSRLGLSVQEFPHVVARLAEDGALAEDAGAVRLPEHSAAPSMEQTKLVEAYIGRLRSDPFSPPTGEDPDEDVLAMLIDQGRVVRVSDAVVYEAAAYKEMVDAVVAAIRDNGTINVGQVRDRFNTSRKYALALLEHLDQQRITRRVGDDRVLR